ncbi:MAG: argininosuccinate lyase [Eubacteriaceae bacterium]|nr:argininosuccinate lyase [Eubacteriaceae bacterium]
MAENKGKLWAGRFSEENDRATDDFNSSLSFDKRLYPYDITGSVAHVTMLGEQGLIPGEDAKAAVEALQKLLEEIGEDPKLLDGDYEDIHMAVEAIITERIGNPGQRIHTGRSRNDQVALDMKMYVIDTCDKIISLLKTLIKTLLEKAKSHTETIMPGYTHIQKAQAVSYAHYLCAYCEMFTRDIGRLKDTAKRCDEMPLGTGALAATTLPLNRERVAELLGFSAISRNSLDAVSDRDHCIEFLSAASVIMMHLSRFCEEIIWWASEEYSYIKVTDAYSTGSSMMPQKRNPDVAELIRGKTGRVYGDLLTLLTVMKGIPLAYNKDMQEDKQAVFDAADTLEKCISIFTGMIAAVEVNTPKMKKAVEESYMDATEAAEFLVSKGCPFRRAHFIIGKLVGICEQRGIWLRELPEQELKDAVGEYYSTDFRQALNAEANMEKKTIPASPSKAQVEGYIEYMEKFICGEF